MGADSDGRADVSPFLSTLPRRERHAIIPPDARATRGSIHASAQEPKRPHFPSPIARQKFQPTLPRRERHEHGVEIWPVCVFQPTLQRLERLRRPALELPPDVVSMHAPVKERRGRQSRDTPATCFHLPSRRRKAGYRFSRMSLSVRAGVIASGSSLISMIAGLPLVRARSKAGAKASVVSTVSPWPPKARA